MALVDEFDLPLVDVGCWQVNLRTGYAVRGSRANGKRETVYLHRLLLGLKKGDGLLVDHINMNRLDNRRVNLRIVTQSENEQNRRRYKGSSSQFRGVWRPKNREKWHAAALLNKRKHHLGVFADERAAAARVAYWRLLHMPFTVEVPGDFLRD